MFITYNLIFLILTQLLVVEIYVLFLHPNINTFLIYLMMLLIIVLKMICDIHILYHNKLLKIILHVFLKMY